MCAPIMGMIGEYLYELYLQQDLGFSIKGSGLKLDTADDAQKALSNLGKCSNLKYLELEGNTLGVDAAKEIGKYLEDRSELEIALWKDLFTGRLKNEIPKAIDFLLAGVDLAGARLQRLDLSDNAIGPLGMEGLIPFFKTPSSFSLKELILNNNGLGPDGGSMLAEALSQCFILSQDKGGELFQLKVLVCGRNRLENKAALRFAHFFSMVTSLEEIHLPQNGIRPESITYLAMSFSQNLNLRVINMNDNTVGVCGSRCISEAISEMKFLEEINFGDCLLSCDGALEIIQGLVEGNRTIRCINLESNEIDGETGIVIANYLKSCDNLSQVYFSGNEFGSRYLERIMKLLMCGRDRIDVDIEEETDEDDEYPAEIGNASFEPELGENGISHKSSSYQYSPISPVSEEEWTHSSSNQFNFTFARQLNFDAPEEDDITSFLTKPSSELFGRLKPVPEEVLVNYFRTKRNKEMFPFLCVSTAIKLSNQVSLDKPIQKCFNSLLMEVITSEGSNTFATILLIYFGFIRPEEKLCSTVLVRPTQSTILALNGFIENSPIPVMVLLCFQEFLKITTPAAKTEGILKISFHLKNSIDKRLSIIPPDFNIFRDEMDELIYYQ